MSLQRITATANSNCNAGAVATAETTFNDYIACIWIRSPASFRNGRGSRSSSHSEGGFSAGGRGLHGSLRSGSRGCSSISRRWLGGWASIGRE